MMVLCGAWLLRITENPINPRGKLNCCSSRTLRCNYKDKSRNRIGNKSRNTLVLHTGMSPCTIHAKKNVKLMVVLYKYFSITKLQDSSLESVNFIPTNINRLTEINSF